MTEPKQRSLDGKEHPSDVMPCKQKATRALDTLIAHSRTGLGLTTQVWENLHWLMACHAKISCVK